MHISTGKFKILCALICSPQYMLLSHRSSYTLWITFLPPSLFPLLVLLFLMQRTYLKRVLYGFHSYIFSKYSFLSIFQISTDLCTIHQLLSTTYCNKRKASRKVRHVLSLLAFYNFTIYF